MSNRWRIKPVAELTPDGESFGLKRSLGPWQLMALGIGAIVGSGIFATVGEAAAGAVGRPGAGPAIVISFVLTAVACAFAALCYAEFASMVPIAGSAYTYAYATLGELVAWIIGWDLLVEYAVGNVAVAISWSGYFQALLGSFGIHVPAWLGTDFRSASAEVTAAAPHLFGMPFVFNLPAFLIVMLVTWVLVRGIRESVGFNTSMVVLKVGILALVTAVGAFHVQTSNWHPFAPNGWSGVSHAAALIFFSYIGFDAISTAAEETKNPQRDMPIGMLGSLAICTVIYVAVALVLTGIVPYAKLAGAEPMADAFIELGMPKFAALISIGAVIATTSVLVVFQLGQTRIFLSMARDGLLPKWCGELHPVYRTPHLTTWATGLFVAVVAGVANISEITELTNIGTLFAFVLVAVGIMIMRRTNPNLPRAFRTPWVPFVPLAAIFTCGYLMLQLPRTTWIRFVVWLAVGMIIYYAYSRKRSRLGQAASAEPPAG